MSQITKELRYGRVKKVETGFNETVALLEEKLQAEGFGVLTEIDVQGTFKKKLDADFRPYKILGVCNPSLAWRALEVEPEIGLLLPCTIVVQESVDGGGITVSVLSPEAMFSLVGEPSLADLAAEVARRLDRVLAAV